MSALTPERIALAQGALALLSAALMGACGVRLLVRLVAVLRGREAAGGLPEGKRVRGASLREAALAAAVTLASRLALYLFAYALYRLAGGEGGPVQSLERLWTHWDVRHYLGIAREGYTAVGDERLRLVFFPLYPLLTRAAMPLTDGSAFMAGTLVSLLCASLSGALLYDLCRMHADAATARLALAYFLLDPLSVFLGCAYTESLFLCLTLAACCLLRRDHPWPAALCGAASAFTRMPGAIVAGLFFIRLLGDVPRGRATARRALSCLLQMGVVFGGLFAYWAINVRVTGDPFAYMIYQRENWHQAPGAFWDSVRNTVYYTLTTFGDGDWLFTWFFQLVSMFFVFALLALREDALPFDLAAYAFVYVAVVLSPTWLLSGARYLFALAPLPLLKARATRRPLPHAVALAVSLALLLLWTYGYTLDGHVL